jgi:hypothetical protein
MYAHQKLATGGACLPCAVTPLPPALPCAGAIVGECGVNGGGDSTIGGREPYYLPLTLHPLPLHLAALALAALTLATIGQRSPSPPSSNTLDIPGLYVYRVTL